MRSATADALIAEPNMSKPHQAGKRTTGNPSGAARETSVSGFAATFRSSASSLAIKLRLAPMPPNIARHGSAGAVSENRLLHTRRRRQCLAIRLFGRPTKHQGSGMKSSASPSILPTHQKKQNRFGCNSLQVPLHLDARMCRHSLLRRPSISRTVIVTTKPRRRINALEREPISTISYGEQSAARWLAHGSWKFGDRDGAVHLPPARAAC